MEDLLTVLSSDGRFGTLVKAIRGAGLADTIAQAEVTLLAPTDEAFRRLPARRLRALLADDGELRQLVLRHLIRGRWRAGDVARSQWVETAQGPPLAVQTYGHRIMLNEAQIMQPDLAACNGLIHVVDAALLPAEEPTPAGG